MLAVAPVEPFLREGRPFVKCIVVQRGPRARAARVFPGFCRPTILVAALAFFFLPGPPLPAAVSGKPRYESIVAGGKHSCAVTGEGKAYCWGANESGQIGDGSKDDRATPAAVASDEAFSLLTAGNAHTCGMTTGGAAFCWGENKAGQLGDGSSKNSTKPVAVPVSGRFRFISAGGGHTCGLTTTGETLCWGNNAQGQLGDGGTEDRGSLAPVRGN